MLFLIEGIPSIVLGAFVPGYWRKSGCALPAGSVRMRSTLEHNLRIEESQKDHTPFG